MKENKCNITVPGPPPALVYGAREKAIQKSDELCSLTVDHCGTSLLISWLQSKTSVQYGKALLWNLCSLCLYLHYRVTSENSFSVPLFFCFDHLVISISIKCRWVERHAMLKSVFLTFLLALLPSNQERAVWAHLRDLYRQLLKGDFKKMFHFSMLNLGVPFLRVMCKPQV